MLLSFGGYCMGWLFMVFKLLKSNSPFFGCLCFRSESLSILLCFEESQIWVHNLRLNLFCKKRKRKIS